MKKITVHANIHAQIQQVWTAWNDPKQIEKWCFASPEWGCKDVTNNLHVGEKLISTMFAKDGSAAFTIVATYTAIQEPNKIEYTLDDGRQVQILFKANHDSVEITETFDTESETSDEFQKNGWQSILNNFAYYVETKGKNK